MFYIYSIVSLRDITFSDTLYAMLLFLLKICGVQKLLIFYFQQKMTTYVGICVSEDLRNPLQAILFS